MLVKCAECTAMHEAGVPHDTEDHLHIWTHWMPFDPTVIEIKELKYHYRRECNVLGCGAKEFAVDVAPTGETFSSPDGSYPT